MELKKEACIQKNGPDILHQTLWIYFTQIIFFTHIMILLAPLDSVDKTKTLVINVTNRNFFSVLIFQAQGKILQQQKQYMCKYLVQP